jgi:serine/threonine protein kinase
MEGLCPKCTAKIALGAKVRYFGDYELLEEIGRGGMGVVFKARQASLNRFVALKMLLQGPFAAEEFVKRFHAEAEAVASLQHPNIVAIHEVGLHEEQHYFSMDYIDGPSLAELVAQEPLPPERAARYVRQIAEAIHYAHQRGILHRDLKPSNVLIDPSDQPRVTDFGLAKRLQPDSPAALASHLTITGQVMGAPSYMPPEQAAGRSSQLGVASDVYALGAVLYHLLTGRPPFVGDTIPAVLAQVQSQEPQPLRELNAVIPRDLETICLHCLRKNPRERYATAAELAEDLRRWSEGKPILARPRSGTERLLRLASNRTVFVPVLALVLLVLVTGGLWLKGKRPTSAAKPRPGQSATAALPRLTWSSGPELLEVYEELRAAVLDGKLYVVGGRTGHGGTNQCVATVQVYDPQTDRWRLAAPLPQGLAAVGLVAHEGKLYSFGGIREPVWWGWPVAAGYVYDPKTDRWTGLEEMPVARSNFPVLPLGGRLVCIGGNAHWPDATARVDAFEPETGSWRYILTMPEPRGGHLAGLWRGQLFVAFGKVSARTARESAALNYDPSLQTWTPTPDIASGIGLECGQLFSDAEHFYFLGRTNVQSRETWFCRLAPELGAIQYISRLPVNPFVPIAVAWDPAGAVAYLVGGDDGKETHLKSFLKLHFEMPASRVSGPKP